MNKGSDLYDISVFMLTFLVWLLIVFTLSYFYHLIELHWVSRILED